MRKIHYSLFALLFVAIGATAAPTSSPKSTLTVTNKQTDSVKTALGHNIVLNSNSSLQRTWYAIHDQSLPVDLVETPGVTTIYESGRVSGDYKYSTGFTINAKTDISAIEVRFVLFDIFGEYLRTLSTTQVEDITAGATPRFDAKWRIWSESETSRYYSSISYIAYVRSKEGHVYSYDKKSISDEIRKISKNFSPEQLDTSKEQKP